MNDTPKADPAQVLSQVLDALRLIQRACDASDFAPFTGEMSCALESVCALIATAER